MMPAAFALSYSPRADAEFDTDSAGTLGSGVALRASAMLLASNNCNVTPEFKETHTTK